MKKLLFTFLLFSFAIINGNAQEKSVEKEDQLSSLMIEIKDGKSPQLYIDGKIYDIAILDLLDPNKIETISVQKNDNTGEDIIKINTVKAKKVTLDLNSEEFDIDVKVKKGRNEPMMIIDGKEVKRSRLNNLDPENIESITIFKGAEAIEKYNAANGVIVVKTKNKKKNKNKKR